MKVLSQKQIEAIHLPKWPGMIVIGQDVTVEQAAEIIIRTHDFDFSTNDAVFLRDLRDVVGLEVDKDFDFCVDKASHDAACKKYRVLRDLEYLTNRQVSSSSAKRREP